MCHLSALNFYWSGRDNRDQSHLIASLWRRNNKRGNRTAREGVACPALPANCLVSLCISISFILSYGGTCPSKMDSGRGDWRHAMNLISKNRNGSVHFDLKRWKKVLYVTNLSQNLYYLYHNIILLTQQLWH